MFDRDPNGRFVIYGIGDRVLTPSGLIGVIVKITNQVIHVKISGLKKTVYVRAYDLEKL